MQNLLNVRGLSSTLEDIFFEESPQSSVPQLYGPTPLCSAINNSQISQKTREKAFLEQIQYSDAALEDHFAQKCVLRSLQTGIFHILSAYSLSSLRKAIQLLNGTVVVKPFIIHSNGRITVLPSELPDIEFSSLVFAIILTIDNPLPNLDSLFQYCSLSIPLLYARTCITTRDYY